MNNKDGIKVVIASFVIQLTLGICYIWSIFQTGVAQSVFNGNNANAALSFSLILAFLSLGSPVAGKLAAKYGTRKVVFLGGIFLFVGFFLASLATSHSGWLIWLGYGIIAGIGMGLTYSTTIALAQKWYVHKKGQVTGIIVAGLGLGGVVFTPIISNLIQRFGGIGNGELPTFRTLAFLFLIVCSVGSIFLKEAPTPTVTNTSASSNDLTASQMFKKPSFYLIAITFMLSVMGGLMMIGFARPIAVARGLESTATIGVLAIALANSMGRLCWGFISDKLGRINTILLLLVVSGLLSISVAYVTGMFIYVIIALIGFCFGGFLSTFPSLTSELFGVKNLATNYGFVLFGFGIGAIVSSQIAGHFKNLAANDINLMSPAFFIAAGCSAIGLFLMIALKKMVRN